MIGIIYDPLLIFWRREWQPTPVLLPGKSHGRRSLLVYSPWGHKESASTESLHFTSLWYGSPFGLMASLLLVSLVTCEVWSLDLYLKRLPCFMVYILLQNSIRHPCSTRDLGPRVLLSLFLSLSLFLADSLERKGQLHNPGNISLFPSFTFSSWTLDHHVPVH